MNLFLDIETIPTDDPAIIAALHAKVAPPKNLKKADTIANWWADEGEAAKAEAVAKTSLDGTFGRVCCIGWAFDDGDVDSLCSDDEKTLLECFFVHVANQANIQLNGASILQPLNVVGHNVAGFDLRFLWQRAIVNGIRPPPRLPWKVKPWDERIKDTMLMWNPDNQKRISLDNLCKALRITSSKAGGLDGSQIAQAWADGRRDEIAAYCRADVEAMRLCFNRMSI